MGGEDNMILNVNECPRCAQLVAVHAENFLGLVMRLVDFTVKIIFHIYGTLSGFCLGAKNGIYCVWQEVAPLHSLSLLFHLMVFALMPGVFILEHVTAEPDVGLVVFRDFEVEGHPLYDQRPSAHGQIMVHYVLAKLFDFCALVIPNVTYRDKKNEPYWWC